MEQEWFFSSRACRKHLPGSPAAAGKKNWSMETLALRKPLLQVKTSEHVDCNKNGSVTSLFPAVAVFQLLCKHQALYCSLHYRQWRREVHGDRAPVRQGLHWTEFLPVRGPLPVPGNIHYGHSRDFSYSPLELFIHCGHNVTFVLQKTRRQVRFNTSEPQKGVMAD